MKRMLVACLVFGLMLGCGSKGVKDSASAKGGAGGTAIEDRSRSADGSADGTGGKGMNGQVAAAQPLPPGSGADDARGAVPGREASGGLAQRSIFFDFDKYDVKSEYKGVIEAHAKFLADHPTARLVVQGNTDERGSREYNLALGQRRADAVRKRMGVLGVQEGQIETISFGEEKPRNPGHDEAAWAENRRADLVYKGEQ